MTSIKYVTDQAYRKGRDSVYRDIRDQFAMAALTGLIAGQEHPIQREFLPKWAYEMADAMMKERENG